MEGTRVKNTKRNIVFSYIYIAVSYFFIYLSRQLIVKILGSDYLGLSSLFSSILSVLSMAELGFSGAIVYNMYKPLAEGDEKTVCALLAFYRKIYRVVGIVILLGGLAIMPFLPKLVKGSYPSEINIYILYLLYLGNTCVSYFLFAYKSSLLDALQRVDLDRICYTVAIIIQYGMQLVSLAVFKNYYLFVLCSIIGTVGKNILTSVLVSRRFPQYVCEGTLSNEVKKDIIGRVKGLLVGKISSVTYSTFDSIILSMFIGLTSVAIYGNYGLVTTGIGTLIAQIRNSMQASVGNCIARESVDKNYSDMLLWQFLFSVIATFCVSCLFSLIQPFMIIWMGENMLLPLIDVAFLSIMFFTGIIQHSFFLYLSGNGLWWEIRMPYILSAVVNIILNFILGKYFGTTGIIFASMFVSIVFVLIWQCVIVFKCYFKRSPKEFFIRESVYTIVAFLISACSYYLTGLVRIAGFKGLIVKGIVCAAVSTVLLFVIYHRTKMFQKAKVFAKVVITSK